MNLDSQYTEDMSAQELGTSDLVQHGALQGVIKSC